jgi:uncharacterized repeat protein (TIGR03847 family)
LGIGYDEDSNKIILHAQELQTEEDEEPNAIARIHLERRQIVGFVRRARELVAAGRPLCPYCGRPLDPEQGLCACYN